MQTKIVFFVDALDLEPHQYKKEGKPMSETNATSTNETKQSQTQFGPFRFVFILIASQLQGISGALKKKDAKLAAWLFWAGQAVYAAVNGSDVTEEPSGIDSFDSPLSDAAASWFLTVGYQLRSLGAAIGMYDANDVGKDDAFAHLLIRIASVLITLGNK